MKQRFLAVTLLAGSLTAIGNLPAQDNRNANQRPPKIEDRLDQLEQTQQDLKAQVNQLRDDVADLQDRVRRLEGTPQTAPPFPVAAPSSEASRRASSESEPTPETGSAQGQSFNLFYQQLQSGGHWFEDPTYGYVWQPEVAGSDENWRPYSDGHWAYTDRGWTWVSNEEFGWATYHYGRWAYRSDAGWVWVPGSDWAPAWVSWRESDNYVAWAPLPPEVTDESRLRIEGWVDNYYGIGPAAYIFLRTADLARPTYRGVIMPPRQNVEFFTETTNVTNIVYQNNAVIVEGPRYEQIASRVNLPRYKLNYVTENQGRFGINTRGNQLQVVAPPPVLQRSASVPPKIERQLAQAPVYHGWQGVNPATAAQLKQAMEKQAPIPANLPPNPPTPKRVAVSGTPNQPPRPADQQPARANPPPVPTASPAQAQTQTRPTPAAAAMPPRRTAEQQEREQTQQAPPARTPAHRTAADRAGEPPRATEPSRTPEPPRASEVPRVTEPSRAAEPARRAEAPRQQPAPEREVRREQPNTETRSSNERRRESTVEPQRPAELKQAPSESEGTTVRGSPVETRRKEPSTRQEGSVEPQQRFEPERPVERKQPEQTGSEQNRNERREGSKQGGKPRNEEAPAKQRGESRE